MAAVLAVAALALAVAIVDLLLILGMVRRLRAQARPLSPLDVPGFFDIYSGPPVGSQLPEFSATTADGEVIDNSRFAAAAGCIAFVSVNCLPCKGALADLDPYLRATGIGSRHILVVVSDDPAGESPEAARAGEFAGVVTGDQAAPLARRFGVRGFPTLLAIQDGFVTANAPVVAALRGSAAAVAPSAG